MRSMGIRERARGLETWGSGLIRVLSDIGRTPSLVKLGSLFERSRTCHHDAGRRCGLTRRRYACALGEDVVAVPLDLGKDSGIEDPSGTNAARRSWWQHRDSGVSKGVEGPIAFDLVRQEGSPLRRRLTLFKINVKESKIILG